MIRIVCIEDDPIVQNFLRLFLSKETDLELVGMFREVEPAMDLVRHRRVDVIILDYFLSRDRNGLQLLAQLQTEGDYSQFRRPAVLVHTGHPTDELAVAVRRMGGKGMVEKSRAYNELVPAIRWLAQGHEWWNDDAALSLTELGAADQGTFRVLIAENDRSTRPIMEDALQKLGGGAVFAYTTDSANEMLGGERFDLVFLNCRLPGRTRGTDLLNTLEQEHPNLPVVLLGDSSSAGWGYRPIQNVRAFATLPVDAVTVERVLRECVVSLSAGSGA